MAEKDADAAEAQLKKITEIDPKDMRAVADLGDFMLAQGKRDDARVQYGRIVEDAPSVPGGYLKLARLDEIEGNRDAAIAILEKGYARNPDSIPLLAALIKVYTADGKLDRATVLCDQKIAAYPDNAFTYNLLAQVQVAAKKAGGCRSVPEEGHRAQPAMERAPRQPGPALSVPRQNRGGCQEPGDGHRRRPGQYRRLHDPGLLMHQKNGARDKARAVYEKALATDPRRWAAANNLAFLIAESPDTDADLERALDRGPPSRADQTR